MKVLYEYKSMSEIQVREVGSLNCKDHNFTSFQMISLLNQSCKSRCFIRILLMFKHLVKYFCKTWYLFPGQEKNVTFKMMLHWAL